MRSRVNLVAILLTLSCAARLLETAKSDVRQQGLTKGAHKDNGSIGKKIFKGAQNKLSPIILGPPLLEHKTTSAKTQMKKVQALAKDYLIEKDRPRRKRRKMDRTMMALLMAYKMKFVALVPTLVGGLILLKATALLAGFFFALFAAVLGLKVH
ncbi:PREDICTED: uncharacterized protein LOC107189163 [Dufourea novaeangliae]|uniref:uncharacterized protein LOC107189163 n=1 Tax=Dufourea novaeangliae TaxID=178035 RepID=UPI000766EF7C|nr:PREDICTED: uncharacterized protein LOC107189163 [Dufourea novaeangliae]